MSEVTVNIGKHQDIGARERQEDSFADKRIGNMQLAVLADGMGGYEGGDRASKTVIAGFISFVEQQARQYAQLIPDLLVDATYSANASLAQLKQNNTSNMGSTMIGLLIQGNHAWWVSVGDSSLYLWRDGRLQKINAEHNHYQDLRQKVFLGQISNEQAINDPERDGLTSALMGREMKYVDVSHYGIDVKAGDIFLLASDGLETITSEQITTVMRQAATPQQIAEVLVQQVKRVNAPQQDNVSVLAVGIRSSGSPVAATTEPSSSRSKLESLVYSALMLLAGGIISVGAYVYLGIPPKATSSAAPATPPPAETKTSNVKPLISINEEQNCGSLLKSFNEKVCAAIKDEVIQDKLGIKFACKKIGSTGGMDDICLAATQPDMQPAAPPAAPVETEECLRAKQECVGHQQDCMVAQQSYPQLCQGGYHQYCNAANQNSKRCEEDRTQCDEQAQASCKDEPKADQAKADQAKADQAKADQAKADQAKADQSWWGWFLALFSSEK
jgi:serine/threonine protein phosphatase PrpC